MNTAGPDTQRTHTFCLKREREVLTSCSRSYGLTVCVCCNFVKISSAVTGSAFVFVPRAVFFMACNYFPAASLSRGRVKLIRIT